MKENQIKDPNLLYPGQKIYIPNTSRNDNFKIKNHTVKRGENISIIAKEYGTNKFTLIRLNNLRDANNLYVGQNIKVPLKNTTSKNNYKQFHITKEGESLSHIAIKYNMSIKEIMSLNNIKDPNMLISGSKIYLKTRDHRKNINAKIHFNEKANIVKQIPLLRTYGPLQINWSHWQIMNGSYVAPIRHENGNTFYIAVNCPTKKLNLTINGKTWRTWIIPQKSFENELVKDVCQSLKDNLT
tara:strand:+ start:1650 stop:2372 length:723 start_codon:yes stop_codon:yes gene_type:complete